MATRIGFAWVVGWLLLFTLIRGAGAVEPAVEWLSDPPVTACTYVAADRVSSVGEGGGARGRC